ncbi:MAG: anthranilate phosphoribosyltransferase [bacterium]
MLRFIKEVGRGKNGARDLTVEEALEAAGLVLDGASSEAQTAALLMAIRVKGEAPQEIEAFARALRARTRRVPVDPACLPNLLDCAGPHDGRKGFAATLPVSVLCAAAGIPVLLHASPTLPPKLGSSLEDVLRCAGYSAPADPSETARDLGRRSIAYFSAETFCPPLARLRRLREDIGVRSLFNSAEKLLNAAGARRLLVGVNHGSALERLSAVPLPEGVDRLVIVQGLDGSEDLPVHKVSSAFVLNRERRARRLVMDPGPYKLHAPLRQDYSLTEQAELIERVLSGEDHPALVVERNLVLYNAAFRLWIFGGRETLNEGLQEATELLKSGQCLTRYIAWVRRRPEALRAA